MPPRFEGGVTKAFAEYPVGTANRLEVALGGVDVVTSLGAMNDFDGE
jgi:hypothetical protein